MSNRVLEITVRSDTGGGPKHLLDLLKNNTSYNLYSAIPFGYTYSQSIQKYSKGSINIPHRKFSLFTLIRLIKYAYKHDIKIIHSHGRGAGYYSRAMKLFGFKIVHTLHGVHKEESIISSLKLFIDRLFVFFTDQFICVSNGEKIKATNFKVICPERTSTIFNGVSPQVKRSLSLPLPKVGMLGRITYQKGYDLLIQEVEKFCKNNPSINFEIVIAGDGEDRDRVLKQLQNTQYAKKKITFIGNTNSPIDFLITNSHFLSFSRFEGMPISVLEAMSVGLPCLVSDVVGNNDIINETNGLLFNLSNFQEKFKVFLTQGHSSKSQQALEDIEKVFNIENQVKATIEIYNQF